jgi:hypothetical protein
VIRSANAGLGKNNMAATTMAFLEAFVFKQPDQILEVNIAICLAGHYSLPDFLVPRHRAS